MSTSNVERILARQAAGGGGAWAAIAAIYLAVTLHYLRAIGPYIVDDAFIFMRYANNFALGYGFVYNPGEPVEGYTSFLWVLILGLARRVGLPLLGTAQALGIAFGLAALFLLWRSSRLLFPASPWLALVPSLFLATNRTFAVWSIEGLEGHLFTVSIMATLFVWLRLGASLWHRAVPALGLVAAFMPLARPEGLLLAGLVGFFAFFEALRRKRLHHYFANAAAFAAVIGVHLAFRIHTYGDLLPNTFYAKVTGFQLSAGLHYLWLFTMENRLVYYGPLTVIGIIRLWSSGTHLTIQRWAIAGSVSFTAYLTAIGGDYFEFRFLAPMLPFLGIFTAQGLALVPEWPRRWGASRGLPLFVFAVWMGLNAETMVRPHLGDSVLTSVERESDFTRDFLKAARWLARNVEPDETIAIAPAGAIAFFSCARLVDMRGLNDREIARNTRVRGPIGHQHAATMEQLMQRGVTYLVGHPRISPNPVPPDRGFVSAEIAPGEYLLLQRLDEHARLEPRLYRLAEHRGSLSGWEPPPCSAADFWDSPDPSS